MRILGIAIALTCLLVFIPSQSANNAIAQPDCTPPPSGLVSWWPAEGNADDITYNNPGVAGSGVSYIAGKVGQAFSLNGDNGVTVPDSVSLNVGTGDFSMDAWISTTSIAVVQIIVDKRVDDRPPGETGPINGYAFFLLDGALSLQLADGPGFTNYFGTAIVNNGVLRHVAVTVDRDSSTGIKLYVDGVLVNTFNPTDRPGSLDNTADFLIGQHIEGAPFNLVGEIDELEFYNVSLSASDILAIYDAGIDGKCSANLGVEKFYDANANGVNDFEALITGWEVSIVGGLVNILGFTTIPPTILPAISYTVTESTPNEPNWISTTTNPVTADLATGDKTVEFGNVCTGEGGGHSKGFWTNMNGEAAFGTLTDPLGELSSLNLFDASGGVFDPLSYSELKTWLSKATSKNMAYMLSAQLAAMKLNVLGGYVDGTALVYAPGLLPFAPITGLNSLGFISIDDLMSAADDSLGLDGDTPAGDPSRAYQEALKNALDMANNDTSFVQETPCLVSFP